MKCSLCEREENGWSGRMVQDCDKCEQTICGDCAEVDYDCVGDPPRYINTQWICDSLKGGCREAS